MDYQYINNHYEKMLNTGRKTVRSQKIELKLIIQKE